MNLMPETDLASVRLTLLPQVDAPKSKPSKRSKKTVTSTGKHRALTTEDIEQATVLMASKMVGANGVAEAELSQLGVLFGLFEPRACYISRFISASQALQVSTVRGRDDERIRAAKPGQDVSGRAFASGEVVRENGLVASPLQTTGGPNGALTLVDPKNAVTDAVFRALAAQVSAACEVARLRDDTLRRTKDLETALLGLKAIEKGREDVLSNLSHNLKTPLTTLKAYLPMLLTESLGPLTPKQEKALAACDRSADRLLKSIDDLLITSRLRAGRMTLEERPFGLKAVIEEVCHSLQPVANQSNLKLIVHASSEVNVRGDRQHILDAAFRLVERAIHQSDEDTLIELSLQTASHQWVEFSVTNQQNALSVEEVDRVFDTLRPSNNLIAGSRSDLGLGLPIAAKIIRLHGGRIEANSSKLDGTRLRFFLPVFAGALHTPVDLPVPIEGGILLVEDDADCREILTEVLRGEGYRVYATSSAAEARTLFAEHRPAMVLLDLRLSDDDGRTVLHFIRTSEALKETSVFVISGASDAAEIASGKGIDRIDGFFEKPLQLSKLLHTVASVVAPSE